MAPANIKLNIARMFIPFLPFDGIRVRPKYTGVWQNFGSGILFDKALKNRVSRRRTHHETSAIGKSLKNAKFVF